MHLAITDRLASATATIILVRLQVRQSLANLAGLPPSEEKGAQ
jgi:hypothetical protein